MGSSAKTGIFLLEGHRSSFLGQKHKSAICDKTPPHLHIKPSLYVCRTFQGSQIFKQNWIIPIRSRVIVILLIWVSSALGAGQVSGGCPRWSVIVYMNSGMFRGKESSNRIELSQLVQELLKFGVLGSLRLWGGGRWMGGVWGHLGTWGGVPTCMHMHVHACTHTHAHVYMYRNCKWLPTWRHPCWSCLTCMCVCVCVCTCMYVCVRTCIGHFATHPSPSDPHPPICHPPRGTPHSQLKFDNTWTNQDISILFKDLKSVTNSPPMGGCIVRWVGGWMGGLMGGVNSNH